MFGEFNYEEDAFGRRISGIKVEVLVMNGQPIGHLHDDVILPLRPEFISFFLSYLNLVIEARFAQEKNSGSSSSKMTPSCK